MPKFFKIFKFLFIFFFVFSVSIPASATNNYMIITGGAGNLQITGGAGNLIITGSGGSVYSVPWYTNSSWYSTSWSYRKSITVDNTKVSADLTNFPVLINLSSDASLASHAKTDGSDIIFTSSDGTTKLERGIERYTTATGELVAWIKIPSLANSTDTVIYMYYGNAAGAETNSTSVWDSNYKIVHHYPNGTTLSAADSTSNGFTGTISGAVAGTGKIDGAGSFNGTTDYFTVADNSALDLTTAATIEFWFKRTAAGVQTCIAKFNTTGNQMSYGLQVHTDNKVYWSISSNGSTNNYWYSTQTVTDTNWNHLVGTFDAGTYKVYLNGQEISGTPPASPSTSIFNSTTALENRYNASNYNSGLLDELHISNTARAAEWIATEYNNQNSPSTFYSLGSESTN